jgi:N-methylhydantoinase A/oxoprolinase/acetone carboxylase beta subunit
VREIEPVLRAGVDVGGTFTDILLVDDASGDFWVGKTLTTPEDPSLGVRQGLGAVLQHATGGGVSTVVAAGCAR